LSCSSKQLRITHYIVIVNYSLCFSLHKIRFADPPPPLPLRFHHSLSAHTKHVISFHLFMRNCLGSSSKQIICFRSRVDCLRASVDCFSFSCKHVIGSHRLSFSIKNITVWHLIHSLSLYLKNPFHIVPWCVRCQS